MSHTNINTDDCWLFARRITQNGYGQLGFMQDGKVKVVLAHRFMYECIVGDIPSGLQIDHLCKVRRCINPLHLEPVTAKENLRRAQKDLYKYACKNGHTRTGENTRTIKGNRYCILCLRNRWNKYDKSRRK